MSRVGVVPLAKIREVFVVFPHIISVKLPRFPTVSEEVGQ